MGASVAMHYGDDAISAYRGLSFASSNASSFAHQAGSIATISKPLASSFTTIAPLSKTAQVSMPSRSIVTMPFGCFVAGTPVLSAEGERPIETLRVGERVLTPQSGNDDSTVVVPTAWRKVALSVAHEDGSTVELELLRPVTWIEEHECKAGSRIWLEMDELGVKGWATTRSVEACPQIASGRGRVILATMQRIHPQVVRLDLADDSELEATANHPLYSLTRNDWTAAGELKEGEILATADGSTTVRAVSFLLGEHRVFNLEVETDHCYFTGHARVLSHNTCAAAKTPLTRLQGSFDDLAEQHLLPQFRALDPNLKAGYTGSFRTGTVGNPSKPTFGQPIDLNKFDVDYWIESDVLFQKFGPNLKANPEFRKILSETPGFEGLKANKEGFSIKFKPAGG